MQSSLARVILSALSFSLCPPVSVYSTGAASLNRSFSRQCRICGLYPKVLTRQASRLNIRICLYVHASPLERLFRQPSRIPSCVTPSLSQYTAVQDYYPVFHSPSQLCLCLGPDSPRADKPSPGNLGLPAGGILALLLATHSCILTSDTSSIPFRTPSTAYRTLSYQTCLARFRGFGSCLSPVISSAQILSTSELLRTLSRYGCF